MFVAEQVTFQFQLLLLVTSLFDTLFAMPFHETAFFFFFFFYPTAKAWLRFSRIAYVCIWDIFMFVAPTDSAKTDLSMYIVHTYVHTYYEQIQ